MKKPRPSRAIGRVGSKRRAAGRTLLALGVIVAGVWVWSVSSVAGYRNKGWHVFVTQGRLSVNKGTPPMTNGFYAQGLEPAQHKIDWTAAGAAGSLGGWDAWIAAYARPMPWSPYQIWSLVLWPIPLILFAAGIPILRSGILARRRAKANACGKCGYSLAGLGKGAPCPECGKGAGTT